jgi:hypothetical protein
MILNTPHTGWTVKKCEILVQSALDFRLVDTLPKALLTTFITFLWQNLVFTGTFLIAKSLSGA